MGLVEVATEVIGLLRQGQMESALTQVSAAISSLALAAPTRTELASRVRGRCRNERFGVCETCGGSISPKRLATFLLDATNCDSCFRK